MAKETQNYEELAVESLVPYENNARTHSEEQIEKICKSIQEFGFINPVLVYKGNIIIAGHGRVMAAKKLGIDKVPCLHVEHLTEEQMRAYVIADNKLAEDAGWDLEMLKSELADLQDLDFDISLTGFDSLADIDFGEDSSSTNLEIVEDNYEVELPAEPKAKPGEIYKLGGTDLCAVTPQTWMM